MDKMKCIALTVFIIVAVFCSSGYTIRCYTCEQSPMLCRLNVTCNPEEDTCLQVKHVNLRTYSCWKWSQCNMQDIANHFQVDSFRYYCCQRELCNKSPSILPGIAAAALSVSAVTMVWMM